MKPVFLLGVARTGSKLYQHVLTQHTDIDIAPEIQYLLSWVHAFQKPDFQRVVCSELGYPLAREQAPELVELLYSGKLTGTFWQFESEQEHESGIGAIDRADLLSRWRENGLSWRGILTSLLLSHARASGKSRPGAKFPVNIARYQALLDWYPTAFVIHIVRHPCAILASMIAKDYRRGDGLTGVRSVATVRRTLYLLHQYRWAGRLHAERSGDRKYIMIRFEQLVRQPEATIKRIFRFVGADGEGVESIRPPVVDSSFRPSGGRGWDEDAADRWRERLSPALADFVQRSLSQQMTAFGYGDART